MCRTMPNLSICAQVLRQTSSARETIANGFPWLPPNHFLISLPIVSFPLLAHFHHSIMSPVPSPSPTDHHPNFNVAGTVALSIVAALLIMIWLAFHVWSRYQDQRRRHSRDLIPITHIPMTRTQRHRGIERPSRSLGSAPNSHHESSPS
jgi:hypothetical protein